MAGNIWTPAGYFWYLHHGEFLENLNSKFAVSSLLLCLPESHLSLSPRQLLSFSLPVCRAATSNGGVQAHNTVAVLETL